MNLHDGAGTVCVFMVCFYSFFGSLPPRVASLGSLVPLNSSTCIDVGLGGLPDDAEGFPLWAGCTAGCARAVALGTGSPAGGAEALPLAAGGSAGAADAGVGAVAAPEAVDETAGAPSFAPFSFEAEGLSSCHKSKNIITAAKIAISSVMRCQTRTASRSGL
jgi:hypothetical protein